MLFEPIGNRNYRITVSDKEISAEPLNFTGSAGKIITIPHYTPEIFYPKTVESDKFCIVKKTNSGCKSVVELCAADDKSCCSPSICPR